MQYINVWIDEKGQLRYVGPFTPENEIVRMPVFEEDTAEDVFRRVREVWALTK